MVPPFYLVLGHKTTDDSASPDILHFGDKQGPATAAFKSAQANRNYKVVELSTVRDSIRQATLPPAPPAPANPA